MKSPDRRLLVLFNIATASVPYHSYHSYHYYRKHALIWTCEITTYRASTSLAMTLPYERIGLLAGTSGAAPISAATVLLRFRLHPVERAKSSVVVLLRVLGVSRKPLPFTADD